MSLGGRRNRQRTTAAALLALCAGCAVPGVLLPENDLLRDVWLRGRGDVPTIALTFDDGPNGRCTEAVLDALGAVGAPATFFVLGANVEAGQDDALLARMVREGHGIGVHSHRHGVRVLFFEADTEADIRRAAAAVRAGLVRGGVADPPDIRLYRPPFGMLTGPAARAAAKAGMFVVEWTIAAGDWRRGRSAEDVAGAILSRARPGDVVVLHDGDQTSRRSQEQCVDRALVPAVVRLVVPALVARGLRPAPLAEVLGLPAQPGLDAGAGVAPAGTPPGQSPPPAR